MENMRKLIPWLKFQTYEDNPPLAKPGVYLLHNLVNDKGYVGLSNNVKRRIRGYAFGGGHCLLQKALKKHGPENFVVRPLFYLTALDRSYLFTVEKSLIVDFDTVARGYNLLASSEMGPSGEKFREIMRLRMKDLTTRSKISLRLKAYFKTDAGKKKTYESFHSPEIKAKINAIRRDPQRSVRFKARMKIAMSQPHVVAEMRERWADSEYKAKLSSSIRTAWSDPELRRRQSETLKRALADPEVGARHAEQAREAIKQATLASAQKVGGSVWITNGTANKRVRPEDPVPAGWHRGRAKTVSFGPKPRAPGDESIIRRGWITNGTENTQIPVDANVPVGWTRGVTRSVRSGPAKGSHFWITDGALSAQHPSDSPIPDGWTRGRVLA